MSDKTTGHAPNDFDAAETEAINVGPIAPSLERESVGAGAAGGAAVGSVIGLAVSTLAFGPLIGAAIGAAGGAAIGHLANSAITRHSSE